FLSRMPRPPSSPLFPYTTLFRSVRDRAGRQHERVCAGRVERDAVAVRQQVQHVPPARREPADDAFGLAPRERVARELLLAGEDRSEEHTSELQSLTNLVCRLLLE